jgi:sodium transport system permease protein
LSEWWQRELADKMKWRNIAVVYRKELTDSLRDRRTLLSMIVIPTLLMPLFTLGVGALSAALFGRALQEIPVVMALGGEDSPQIMAQLKARRDITIVPGSADYATLISNKKVRAAVEIPENFDAALARGESATVRIYMYEGELRSSFGVERLQRFFREFRDRTVRARLEASHQPTTLIEPLKIEEHNVAPPERVAGALLGGLIPYFVILFCMTGAMYPAMDLTAGEKERGTMETILCSPVSRTHLVIGKFLMVLTASLAAAVLSMLSMGLTLVGGTRLLLSLLPTNGRTMSLVIRPQSLLWVFLMIVPLAVLFSAALLAIALFARSYKEAQSYLSPLAIIVLLPAIISVLPGVELNAGLALIPVLNTSLASKEIVAGIFHWQLLALILISSSVYAAAALMVAVRLFQRESVLFRT